MKYNIYRLFALFILIFTVQVKAQLEAPDVEAVFGGRINAIHGIALNEDTSRIFIAAESANSIFYADVYSNTASPVFGNFTVLQSAGLDDNLGEAIQSIQVHKGSGQIFFLHQSGLRIAHPDDIQADTLFENYVEAMIMQGDHLFFKAMDSLYFGWIDSTGEPIHDTANSPLYVGPFGGLQSLVINPLDSTIYFFVEGTAPQLYKTTDKFNALNSSTTWDNITPTTLDPSVQWKSLGIGPDGRLFIGGATITEKYIAFSDDDSTWNDFASGIGGVAGKNFGFSGDSSAYYVYYAKMYSNNKGESGTWNQLGHLGLETHPNDGDVFVDPVNSDIVYFTTDQGIGATTDRGETIFEIDNGVEAVQVNDFDMTGSKNTGWLASKSGVRYVHNYTTSPSWSYAMFPQGDGSPYYSIEIDPTDTTKIYAGNLRVYFTDDDGASWNRIFSPENAPYNFSPLGTRATSIEVCPWDNNIIFAGFDNQDTMVYGGLFYSYDGGTNWDQILIEASSAGEDIDVMDIDFNIEDGDTVAYVGAYYTLSHPQGYSVYRLVKTGDTWIPAQDMSPSGTSTGSVIVVSIFDIQVSPTGDTVYAVGTDAGTNHPTSYFKSLTDSAKWTPMPLSGFPISPGKTATAFTIGRDTVYAAVDNEVYFHAVGTSSWTLGYTYPVGTRINFLYFDELLVGTNYGLFGHAGTETAVGINNGIFTQPGKYSLDQNYPNPFNPATVISYNLPEASKVTLKVYDILGREAAVLVNGIQNAGRHNITFNANGLASGVYIYRIEAGSFTQTKKMILLK